MRDVSAEVSRYLRAGREIAKRRGEREAEKESAGKGGMRAKRRVQASPLVAFVRGLMPS